MTEYVLKTLLAVIVSEWQRLSPTSRPLGVWIRAYPPIPSQANAIDPALFPDAVWFLSNAGLTARNVWEWQRFWTVQCEKPWCQRGFGSEPNAIFGRTHQIGRAAFAPFPEPDAYYLEVVWAGLLAAG